MAGQPQYCSLFSVCRADGTVTDGDPYLSLLNPPLTAAHTHTHSLPKLDFILQSQSGMNKSFSPALSCRLVHVRQCNVGEIKELLHAGE